MPTEKIENTSTTSLADQLANKIRAQILKKKLRANDRLPPVRELAKEHRIDPMTAYAAIKTLSAQGILETAGTRGTFVSDNAFELTVNQNEAQAKRQLLKTFRGIVALGVSVPNLKSLVGSALAELNRK